MTTQTQGNGRKSLVADRRIPEEPAHFAVLRGTAQEGVELKPGSRGTRQASDELSADAMSRVTSGFDNPRGNACAAQRKAEGKSGKSASDDFDRA
jgi:hypothetical protein